MRAMSNLKDIKSEIEKYANNSGLTELQIIEKLEKHYFNKKVNENLRLYKKGDKKVNQITKDLKISPRKFYAILEKKKIEFKKYKKDDLKQNI
jgi:predicted HTH domain antitoxin